MSMEQKQIGFRKRRKESFGPKFQMTSFRTHSRPQCVEVLEAQWFSWPLTFGTVAAENSCNLGVQGEEGCGLRDKPRLFP